MQTQARQHDRKKKNRWKDTSEEKRLTCRAAWVEQNEERKEREEEKRTLVRSADIHSPAGLGEEKGTAARRLSARERETPPK